MSYKKMSDKELVNSFIDGDKQSFEELVKRHHQKIYGYIFSLVKDQALADDLIQDVFIKVINTLKAGSYRDEGKFVQWVMRISHNLVIDHFRKSNRFPTVRTGEDFDIFDVIGSVEDSIEQELVKKQIREDVKKLIRLLPEEQRRVLIMRHYGEMSFKEIAERTGVSINTALGRMRYALINMRKYAEEKEMILN